MPLIWGIPVMAGLQFMQAEAGANASAAEAAAQRANFEEAEFQRRWQNQIENRNVAKQNAMRWFNNKMIAETANKRRAEEDFYIRYNWDNQAGAYGKQHKAAQDELYSRLSGQGIDPNSGTARALLRQQNEASQEAMSGLRINVSNQLIGSERKQAQALAGRDFGYNEHVPFIPARYGGPDPAAAFEQSLYAGIIGGAANTMGYAVSALGASQAGGDTTNNYYSLIGGGSSG